MFIVCKIHNNSLGRCIKVDNWDEGVKTVISWAKDQGFDVDINLVEMSGEYYNDDDSDNIFTFSLGIVEVD